MIHSAIALLSVLIDRVAVIIRQHVVYICISFIVAVGVVLSFSFAIEELFLTDVILAILRCVYNFQKCMKR